MKASIRRPSSVEEFKLETAYNQIRDKLLSAEHADKLDQSLAHWALPSDRGLPLAFLSDPLGDLLNRPFEDLMSTSGVGQRKMASLMKLLERAATGLPAVKAAEDLPEVTLKSPAEGDSDLEPSNVSEAHWAAWCETIKYHGLGDEPLGRLALTLQNLPTVIWNTPLSFYAERSLADIRSMKTHGEKRVRAVVEVFGLVHRAVGGMVPQASLAVRLSPNFVRPLELWLMNVLGDGPAPTLEEIRTQLAQPLIDQIQLDLGEAVGQLSAERLGLNGPPVSVREQAQNMELTRARVYQLLEDCTKVLRVRWPEGEWLLAALEQKARASRSGVEVAKLLASLRDLFFHRTTDTMPITLGPRRIEAEPMLAT
jgi:hypothetical protein